MSTQSEKNSIESIKLANTRADAVKALDRKLGDQGEKMIEACRKCIPLYSITINIIVIIFANKLFTYGFSKI